MDVVSMRLTHWDKLVSAMDITLDNRCTHKCRWLTGPWCRGNFRFGHPVGRCVRPPFHDGECMCANCQTDLVYRASQNVSRRDGFTLLGEHHDATACTHLWAKRYAYIYDKADSPSSASSASSDYPWDKPQKDIPCDILLEDSLLEREFHGGSTPSSVANSDDSKHTRRKRRRTFKAQDTIGFLWDLPPSSGQYWDHSAKLIIRAWQSHRAPRTSATEKF